MVWLCGVAGVKAQPHGFTFNMITPRSFVVAGCNWPAMRTKPSAKAAKVAVKRAYKDDLFALAGAGNAKWYNIETVGGQGAACECVGAEEPFPFAACQAD